MADPRFFNKSQDLTLKQIINLCKIETPRNVDQKKVFSDIAPLNKAETHSISFLDNKNYINEFKLTKAGACFFKKDFLNIAPKKTIPLISEDPYHSFALVANAFYPMTDKVVNGIHSKAHIEKNAIYDNTVEVGAGAVINNNVTLGKNCIIGSNSVILNGVVIGDNTIIGPNSTIGYAIIGSNVKIHNGVRIGQDGFGFALTENKNVKIPQIGRVIIKDDVEIGANCTIDRGTGPDTVIDEGVKLDNLVQIGHNAFIGKNSIIVAQSGVSGSTRLGQNVVIGGQVGIAGHLTIGNNVKIAAKSGIMKNIKDNAVVGGVPSVPIKDWHRQTIILKKLLKKK